MVMRSMRRWLKIITGFVFLIVGVIGLFTPILQGILCILAGLGILAKEFDWARRANQKAFLLIEQFKKRWSEKK